MSCASLSSPNTSDARPTAAPLPPLPRPTLHSPGAVRGDGWQHDLRRHLLPPPPIACLLPASLCTASPRAAPFSVRAFQRSPPQNAVVTLHNRPLSQPITSHEIRRP